METLLPSLSTGGPVWALVGILICLVWILIKLLLAEKDKRIEDALKTKNDIIEPLGYLKDSLNIIKDKIMVAKGEK